MEEDVPVDAGVADKRLTILESEFARTLRVMSRESNTLSAIIRQAWDTGDLRALSKNSPGQGYRRPYFHHRPRYEGRTYA